MYQNTADDPAAGEGAQQVVDRTDTDGVGGYNPQGHLPKVCSKNKLHQIKGRHRRNQEQGSLEQNRPVQPQREPADQMVHWDSLLF